MCEDHGPFSLVRSHDGDMFARSSPQPALMEQPAAHAIKRHGQSGAPALLPNTAPGAAVPSRCLSSSLGGVQMKDGGHTPGSFGLCAGSLSTDATLVPSSLLSSVDTSKSPFITEVLTLSGDLFGWPMLGDYSCATWVQTGVTYMQILPVNRYSTIDTCSL